MSYNGWSNRATWLVNVWFEPNTKNDVLSARDLIEESVDSMHDFMKDFLCTSEINWIELLEHCEEEVEEN
jgi:hypothetical protein